MSHQLVPAILYKRVSTDEQDMKRQDASLPAYCRRNQLFIDHTLADPAESGGNPIAKRADGVKLFPIMEGYRGQKQPFAVVVTEQDRLGRDVIDQLTTIRRIWDCGGNVHFTLEGGEVRRDQNEALIGIKAVMAQEMLSQIRKKTRSKMAELVINQKLAGHIPFGWNAVYVFADGHHETASKKPFSFGDAKAVPPVAADAEILRLMSAHGGVVDKRLVDNEAEQFWIHWIVARRAEGWSLSATAKALNSRGVTAKQGGAFQAANVKAVLKNQYTARLLEALKLKEAA